MADTADTGSTTGRTPLHPAAVAIGNASLLGVGYVLLGRRLLAAGELLGTVVLLVLLGTVARAGWFEILVLVWAVALAGHGWWLARRAAVRGGGVRWMVAVAAFVVVALVVTLLRVDAAGIDRSLADARAEGSCDHARTAVGDVWWAHRLGDAPMTARADEATDVCDRVAAADTRFVAASAGDVPALAGAFDVLAGVLRERPGYEPMVDRSLDGFLGRLPSLQPCAGAAVTDWLIARAPSRDTLDRSVAPARRVAPTALVGCGDALLARSDWSGARTRYQQVVDTYPRSAVAGRARAGVTRAVQAQELANVRGLLQPSYPGAPPRYCAQPARYSGARPYGPGVNTGLYFPAPGVTDRLPPEWKARDAADAVLVVCLGEQVFGGAVRSCPYVSDDAPASPLPHDVTFFRIAIPVKAYEVRTGRLVVDTRVEIGGATCPSTLTYSTLFPNLNLGAPDQYVAPSDADVRAAFAPLILR